MKKTLIYFFVGFVVLGIIGSFLPNEKQSKNQKEETMQQKTDLKITQVSLKKQNSCAGCLNICFNRDFKNTESYYISLFIRTKNNIELKTNYDNVIGFGAKKCQDFNLGNFFLPKYDRFGNNKELDEKTKILEKYVTKENTKLLNVKLFKENGSILDPDREEILNQTFSNF